MRAFKNIFLITVCIIMIACGGENLDAYKDKVLEHVASKINTTKELLVKDLDMKIDSMSLSYFLVEDSLVLLERKYKEDVAKQEKWISTCKENIERLEIEKNKSRKDLFYSITAKINDRSIKEYKKKIEDAEAKIQEIRDDYQLKFEMYQARDKKEVIYNIFHYRVTYKIPKKGIHQVDTSMDLFSPDGMTYIKSVSGEIKDYLKSKGLK